MSCDAIYQPLNNDLSEIRLVEVVNSGNNGQVIQCQLSTVSLVEKPKFAALSYVWGDPSITESILLNGQPFPVTVNLAAALRRVRYHWRQQFPDRTPDSFRLWADAIAINQKDIPERNAQVQLMRSIYQEAELTITWLACHTEQNCHTELALQIISVISKEVEGIYPHNLWDLLPIWNGSQLEPHISWMEKHPFLFTKDDEACLINKVWDSLFFFTRLSYWRRVWTFQEVVLPTRIIFAYLTTQVHEAHLVHALTWLAETHTLFQLHKIEKPAFISQEVWPILSEQALGVIRYSYIFKPWIAKLVRTPISVAELEYKNWTIFDNGKDLRASDPRDHVYGLLGVTDTDVVPDYNKSEAEVYLDLTRAMLRETRRADWLKYAGLGTFKRTSDMPSWLPNFPGMSKSNEILFFDSATPADHGVFDANEPTPVIQNSSLNVAALLGPTVVLVQDGSFVAIPGSFDAFRFEELFEFVRGFCFRHPRHVTNFHPLKAFLHTLHRESFVSVPKDVRACEALLEKGLAFIEFLLRIPLQEFNKGRTDAVEKLRTAFKQLTSTDSMEDLIDIFLPHLTESRKNELKGIAIKRDDKYCFNVFAQFRALDDAFRFFEADKYLGIGPKDTIQGDIVCVVNGCPALLVLRQVGDKYIIMGPCFVLGLMNGDAVRLVAEEEARVKRIKII